MFYIIFNIYKCNFIYIQIEAQIQEDWQLLVRDIYSFYPLLIKYVDLQRNHWLRNNISEAEDLYNHIADIFNIWSKSQYFLKEEQNFISANEIDNMVLIMPAATRRSAAIPDGSSSQGGGGKVIHSNNLIFQIEYSFLYLFFRFLCKKIWCRYTHRSFVILLKSFLA